ncbi:MAG: helix-turn-helix domain-containing protein [Pseudomonadales bacterium]|nr:helix-turn-helix domain-containing protein [Pseudomonadales bacterium]
MNKELTGKQHSGANPGNPQRAVAADSSAGDTGGGVESCDVSCNIADGVCSTEAAYLDSGDAVARQSAPTLGGLLRASRISRSISLDEASRKTHVAVAHLAALENNQELRLPQTFVNGYVKNYAEFLGVEPEYLTKYLSGNDAAGETQAVAGVGQGEQPDREAGAATVAQQVKLNSKAVKPAARKRVGFRNGSSWSNGLFGSPMSLLRAATTTTLPLLCLCVLAFAYHSIDSEFSALQRNTVAKHSLGQAPDQLGVLAHEAVTAQQASRAALDNEPATTIKLQPALADATDAVPGGELNSPVDAFNTNAFNNKALQLTHSGLPAAPPVANAAPAVASNAVGETGDLAFASRSSRSLVPNTNMQDMHEPVGPGAVDMIAQLHMQDRLVIQVYEDSWVDVRDGSGGRLYRDLARAGRRIDVSGQLPFSLHLGNAPGLELELNGEPIAITRYRSDNSARLTLASN